MVAKNYFQIFLSKIKDLENMQLIDQLSEKIKTEKLSVLKVSTQTGIPAYRIYKWLDKKGSPKHEDVKILEKWLRNEMDNVPRGGLQLNEDATKYYSKDELITALQTTIAAQQKTIEQLEARLKEKWLVVEQSDKGNKKAG